MSSGDFEVGDLSVLPDAASPAAQRAKNLVRQGLLEGRSTRPRPRVSQSTSITASAFRIRVAVVGPWVFGASAALASALLAGFLASPPQAKVSTRGIRASSFIMGDRRSAPTQRASSGKLLGAHRAVWRRGSSHQWWWADRGGSESPLFVTLKETRNLVILAHSICRTTVVVPPVRLVVIVLGHRNYRTTQRYVRKPVHRERLDRSIGTASDGGPRTSG